MNANSGNQTSEKLMLQDSGIIINKQQSTTSQQSKKSNGRKDVKVSAFQQDNELFPLQEENDQLMRGLSQSSTDDREESQNYVAKTVEDMLTRIRSSCTPVQSKITNHAEDRYRRRQFSLIPEVMDDEFNEHSKVEADSQGSGVSIKGIDDIGYETEKEEDESPKLNFTPHYNQLEKQLAKNKSEIFNPFQSQSYLRRLLSDDSERDDNFFYPSNQHAATTRFASEAKEFKSRKHNKHGGLQKNNHFGQASNYVSSHMSRQSSNMTMNTKMYNCQYDLEAIDERLKSIKFNF